MPKSKGKSKITIAFKDQDPNLSKQSVALELNVIPVAIQEPHEVSQKESEIENEEARIDSDGSLASSTLIENTQLAQTPEAADINNEASLQAAEQIAPAPSQVAVVAEPALSLTEGAEIIKTPVVENVDPHVQVIAIVEATAPRAEANPALSPIIVKRLEIAKTELDHSATNIEVDLEESEGSGGPEEEDDWLEIDNPSLSPQRIIDPSASIDDNNFIIEVKVNTNIASGEGSVVGESWVTNYWHQTAAPAIGLAIKATYDQAVYVATDTKVREVLVGSLELLCMSKSYALAKLAASALVPSSKVSKASADYKSSDIKDQKLGLINQILGFKFLEFADRKSLLEAVNKNHDDQKMFRAIQVINDVSQEQKAVILKALYCDSSMADQGHAVDVAGHVGDIEGN